MIRKILLIAASLFLIWQSYKFIGLIEDVHIDSWLLIVFLAWVINMFITGIFAFAVFALPVENLLPNTYYQIRNPKLLKKIYNWFNVNLFRKFLLATLWREKKKQKKYFNGRADGIDNLITQSKKSEFGHLLPFFILCLVSIRLMIIGSWPLGIATFVINWLGNWYPVILQRHHRMRIARLARIKRRT